MHNIIGQLISGQDSFYANFTMNQPLGNCNAFDSVHLAGFFSF